MKNFGKLITAMVTPFDADLNIDYKKSAELAKYLVANGSDSLVVCGTTGESPTLTEDEKCKLLETVIDAVGDKAGIIMGTGTNDTKKTIAFTKKVEKIGADAALVVTPYYNKPPQDAIVEHFRMVAEETNLPIIVYNIPGRTGTNITPQTMLKISAIKNIIADKESAGDINQAAEIRRITADDFIMWSGDDGMTLPMMSVGAIGVISVASHVAGPQIKAMIEAFEKGEVKKAQEINAKLLPLYKTLFMTANPIPVKAAMTMLGIDVGGLRPPLFPANDTVKEAVRATMKDLSIL